MKAATTVQAGNWLPRSPAGAAVLQGDVTTAISRAVFRELARTGCAALSMETVAG